MCRFLECLEISLHDHLKVTFAKRYVYYHETLKRMIKDPYHIVSNYNTPNILFTIIKSKNFEQNFQSLVLHKLLHYKFEYKIQFSL